MANLHTHTSRYPDDRASFAAVFEYDYGFVDERDAETTLVCTLDPVGAYALRRNARALEPTFGPGMRRLASRLRLHPPEAGRVLTDDFGSSAVGAQRHNESCRPICAGE